MAQFTKQAIMNTFVELLNKKSFDKITVKDIVDTCGINRNTFYYYYADIYALVDEVFESETRKILDEHRDFESWQDGFLAATRFATENRIAVYHIYNSINRDRLEHFLYDVTKNNLTAFVKKLSDGLRVSEADMDAVSNFYTLALVGSVVLWLDGGMKIDQSAYIETAGRLFEGSIRRALEHGDPRFS